MKILLSDMTWSEIRGIAAAGATAVLPTGSTEQHGPHLPAKTDSLLVESVAMAAASRFQGDSSTPRVAVAPTLRIGASDHHRPFFALSISEETYIAVVTQLAGSLAEAGFEKLLIVNGHGGNTAPLRVALSKLKRVAPRIAVATADYWALAAKKFRRLRTSPPGGAAHAGEIETSLMFHLAPDAVRSQLLSASVPSTPPGFEIDLIDGGGVTVNVEWRLISKDGHLGDPTVADAGKGRLFFESAVEAVADALGRFSEYRPRLLQ